MKKFLLVILSLASQSCSAQTTASKSDTGSNIATFRVSKSPDSTGKIFNYAEQMPQFPGGEDAMMDFLRNNIKYPVMAKNANIEGNVILTFVVQTDGTISDIKILRDIAGGCGDEAVRVIKLMPKWAPGNNNGVPVNTQFVLPVDFELSSQ
jgi:protein TonB